MLLVGVVGLKRRGSAFRRGCGGSCPTTRTAPLPPFLRSITCRRSPRPRRAGSTSFFLSVLLLVSFWALVGAPRPPPSARRHPEMIRAGPVDSSTSARRTLLFAEAEKFVREKSGGEGIADLAANNVALLSNLMREYGFGLYDAQRTQGELKETILSIQDQFGYAKPALSAAWRVVSTWERLEPSEARAPLPFMIFRSMLAVALGWGWSRMALALYVSFYCLLRPGELFDLRRCDILMEEEEGAAVMVRIRKSKRWVRGARGQYAKLEGKYVCDWVRQLLMRMCHSESFWPAAPGAFAVRFRALVKAVLGCEGPFTPGSLRTGGATWAFQEWDENLVKLCWRGRWRDVNTLWHYVQELQSLQVLQSLPPAGLSRARELAGFLPEVVAAFLEEFFE